MPPATDPWHYCSYSRSNCCLTLQITTFPWIITGHFSWRLQLVYIVVQMYQKKGVESGCKVLQVLCGKWENLRVTVANWKNTH